MTSSPNQNTFDLIDHYVTHMPAGEFAVLVSGMWGSGKSYFADRYAAHLREKFNIKTIYISLNGVRSIQDLQLQILSQTHPMFINKYTRGAAGLLSSTLKVGIGLKVEGTEANVDIASGLEWLMKEVSFTNDKNGSLLIFDDLERCAINQRETLGYISKVIYSGHAKVVCICAENEIENQDYFAKTKEKVFGLTTKIVPDKVSALQRFSDQLKNVRVKKYLESRQSLIYELFDKSQSDNLRNLRFVLQEFERLIITLELEGSLDAEYIEIILSRLLIISFEHRGGRLKEGKLSFFASSKYCYHKVLAERESDEFEVSPFEKYSISEIQDIVFTYDTWEAFCFHGLIEKESMLESIKERKSAENSSWLKLWSYEDLSTSEFECSLSDVLKKLETGAWNHPLEIVHTIMLLFHFHSNQSLKPRLTESKLKKMGIESLEKHLRSKNYDHRSLSESLRVGAYAGRGYYCRDEAFYIDFVSLFTKTLEEHDLDLSREIASKIPEKISTLDPKDFSDFVDRSRSFKENRFTFPVFQELDIQAFAESFASIAGKRSTRFIVNWCDDVLAGTNKELNEANLKSLNELVSILSEKSKHQASLIRIKLLDSVRWLNGTIQKYSKTS